DVVIALAMAAYATVQGHTESSYNLAAFSDGDMDWQSLRTYFYLQSGGRIILPRGHHYLSTISHLPALISRARVASCAYCVCRQVANAPPTKLGSFCNSQSKRLASENI